jgi:PhnB protein
MAQSVPQPKHTVVPYLRVKGAAKAIEFYTKAFGAKERMRMPGPDGRLMHAELEIGSGAIYLCDEFPEMGGQTMPPNDASMVHLNVPDCDAVWRQAMAAGATATMPLQDMFWGDRFGKFKDPFGHEWSISTTKEHLSPEEMARRGAEVMAQMGKKP